jgi:hypothetical protein
MNSPTPTQLGRRILQLKLQMNLPKPKKTPKRWRKTLQLRRKKKWRKPLHGSMTNWALLWPEHKLQL